MSYDYDCRPRLRLASSDLDARFPIYTKLLRNRLKIEGILQTGANKANSLADRAEDLAKKNSNHPELLKVLSQATDATYKVFDPFRDLLGKGQREVSDLDEFGNDAARQAKNLYEMVKKDLDKAYNQAMQVLQDKEPEDVVKATHALALSVSSLKSAYSQFVKAQ